MGLSCGNRCTQNNRLIKEAPKAQCEHVPRRKIARRTTKDDPSTMSAPRKPKSDPGVRSSPKPIARSDAGVGLSTSLANSVENHPAGPVQHGPVGQAERAFSAASTFLSGVLAISASQFIGAPLKLIDPKFYDGYMAWTKESFAVLVSTMTQWWAPTLVRVTGDESMKDQLYQMDDGTLRCNFPHRLVMMANHQLYTDWLYLWWIAYTNKMHGRIYIILKESLKNIPILGWSAQFYNFIFLARKWETDKPRFRRHLKQLSNPKDPMWLLIFPEGTNLSGVTREKSKAWAEKQGIADMKHQLLPRSTGLQFCLQELKPSTNWLYDCTIAYEGVSPGQYGQDIFTLKSSFFEGRPPKSVNMYWRRFRISDIPVDNEAAFAMWLKNRWTEKDYLLEHFCRHGAFPEGDPVKAMRNESALKKFSGSNGEKGKNIQPAVRTAKFITTEVKAGGMEEFLAIFAPISAAATALSSGSLAPENIDFDALLNKVAQQQQMNLLNTGKAPKATRSQEMLREALLKASKAKKAGQPIQGSTIDKITKNAAIHQREMLEVMSKNGLPKGPSPTAGRGLDPEVQNIIENVHEETRQRLLRATQPASQPAKGPPDVRKSIPMTPIETIVTKPISTLAMQRARKEVQRATTGAAAGKKVKPSPAAKKSVETAKKPVPKKSTGAANAGKVAGKAPGAPKQTANGAAVKAKK